MLLSTKVVGIALLPADLVTPDQGLYMIPKSLGDLKHCPEILPPRT